VAANRQNFMKQQLL